MEAQAASSVGVVLMYIEVPVLIARDYTIPVE